MRPSNLTREELSRFLEAVDPDWRFFFEFLVQTGLRISEMIGLTVGDIAFGKPTKIKVRRQYRRGEWDSLKSRASRRDIPLSPDTARALWRLCADRPADAPLFCSARGSHIREENFHKRVLDD